MVKSPPSKLDLKQLEDIATLKADTNTLKADTAEIKKTLSELKDSLPKTFATNQRVDSLEKQISKNENRLYTLAKEVTTWGTTIGLMTKLLGMW